MKSKILNWIGWKLHIGARWCFWHANSTKHCWICGRNPSMGPIWNGHMTCDICYKEWHWYNNDTLIVDWKGLGRLR